MFCPIFIIKKRPNVCEFFVLIFIFHILYLVWRHLFGNSRFLAPPTVEIEQQQSFCFLSEEKNIGGFDFKEDKFG